jgi:CDP-paratose 2-epimerase
LTALLRDPERGLADPVLITGGAGFIGCNLADRLASAGYRIRVMDALLRPGVEHNLAWLLDRHAGRIEHIDARVEDRAAAGEAVRGASVVFHLAAQVAVTSSMADPIADFEANVAGTLNLLESCRRAPSPVPLVFASTNKVYGDLGGIDLAVVAGRWQPTDVAVRGAGVAEDQPLVLHTPYGCSKGAADQYVLDYARSFGVPTAVLRMSCIYGARQLGTEDQGWVAHFALQALSRGGLTIYGDGRQVRDLLDVRDAVEAYVSAWRRIAAVSGQAFNLGGGPENAVSLLDVIGELERLTGHGIDVQYADWRPSDQRYYVSDTRRARMALCLGPARNWREGLADLLRGLASNHATRDAPDAPRQFATAMERSAS